MPAATPSAPDAFLIRNLEEEACRDQDYVIERATLDMLAGKGRDEGLRECLTQALGDREAMETLWENV